MNTAQVLPQALEAESALLGSVLVDAAGVDVLADLRSEDFYDPRHRMIFTAITSLVSANKPTDRIAVYDAIRSSGRLPDSGGAEYLDELTSYAEDFTALDHYARLIREKSALRALCEAGRKIARLGYESEVNVTKATDDAERILRAALDRTSVTVDLDVPREMRELYAAIEKASANTDRLTSPWPTLDHTIGGFHPGELIMWCAAPKMGKSGVVLTLAHHVAKHHGAVAYFATEMGKRATRMRHVALTSGVMARDQRNGNLNSEQWGKLSNIVPVISEMPFYIFGKEINSISLMRRALREIERKHGSVKLVIVDHVGFMSSTLDQRRESTHERMDRGYRELIDLGEQFQVSIHGVQHVNRAGAKSERPSLSDIRDGGNPEGHAHGVIFVHRPHPNGGAQPGNGVPENQDEQKRMGEFIIAASRDGDTGIIPMRYIGERNFWKENV